MKLTKEQHAELVAQALKNWNEGWDVIYECWDYADYQTAAVAWDSLEDVVADIQRTVDLLREQRNSIEGEVF